MRVKVQFMFVMTLIVRNEGDIIADHLRHHLDLGVDRFLVIDNGSTDGTADILDGFARAGVCDVTRLDGAFDQAIWANSLVSEARSRFAPDWVCALDADKFLSPPKGETLTTHLARLTELEIIRANRINVFGTAESLSDGDWHTEAIYRSHIQEAATRRLYDPKRRMQYPYMCYYAFPKVLFRPHNFREIAKGGHLVTLDPPSEWVETGLDIWHFPIRSRDRFIETIDRRRPILVRDDNLNLSSQYRRWINMIDAGLSIDTILAEILPVAKSIENLTLAGVISEVVPPVRWTRSGRDTT